MGTIYKHELKAGWKSLLIWSVCVGGMGFTCILLFSLPLARGKVILAKGTAIATLVLLYAYDLLARVVPDLEKGQWLSPFSFSNAADILSTGEIKTGETIFGAAVLVLAFGLAYTVYAKRDLAT